MPNKKKKAKEDAIELLKRKAANNGLKNQAQQGARTAKLNTTTTKDNVSTTTSQTGKPSTEAKKSFSNGLKGSQRANTGVNTNSRWNVKKASRYDDNFATTTTRTKGRTNRRTERYDSDFANRRPTTSGRNHAGNTIAGAVKQWVGGQISSVGTTTQELETTARSYNKAKFEGGNDNYSLRSRADAEKARESRNRSARLKEGINLKTAERVYGNYPNSLSRRIIGAGDSLIEKGTRDINKAKEGLGSVGKLAVDLGANATQMAGDRMMAFVPGIGQALAMGSLMNRAGGTASYEARQLGMNPDQQFIYQQGTALIEGLSEGIFNSVSAFRSTYGKGAFSLADRVSTRAAASNIVQNVLKTDFGKSFAVNLSRLGAEMFEEGIEEVVADLAEPALKYALMKSTDPTTQWEGYNPKDIAYDFLVGALMAGLPGGVDVARNISSDIAMSQAYADGQAHADNVISQGLVQNRVDANGKMVKTDAEVLASQLQHQRAQGKDILPSQTRMLERAIGESSEANARAFEQRSAENEQRAIEEGTLRRSTGTYAEEAAYSRGERTVEDKNTEKAKAVMGENPSESSATAVGRVLTGTATNDDIDTILTDPEARRAVEALTGETLSANNSTARQALENIISINEIANKDAIREEVQRTHVEDIAAEINMSKRGGDIFAKNYGEAVSVIGNPSVYEDVFTRLYANGSVKESNFEEAYNRLVLQRGGAVAQYFTEAKAREAFNAGRMAMITENGKISAKAVAEKASQKPSGITFEGEAKSKLSDKQINALTKFAERANVHIRVVETMSKTLDDGTVLSANGAYKDGTIYIAADADNKLITVAKHELTHHIKKMSPERYQELEDFVFQKWYNSDTEAMEDEIRKKQLLYADITVEEAREEIIADASEAFFTDEGAVQEVMSFSEKLGRAIHDGIKALLDTFLDLQDSDNLSKRGYGDFLDDIDILREAEKMWLDALNDTVEKSREARPSAETESEADTEAKHSLKETDKEYLDAVENEDWDKVREMVDKAAKDAGYTTKAYHGTPNKGFTVFDKNVSGWNGKKFGEGNYFSSIKDVAKAYSSGGAVLDENGDWVKQEGGVYDVYLDLGNPFTIDLDEERKKGRKGIRTYSALSNKIYAETAFGGSKYDSVVIKNIKDGSDIQSDVYVVKDSNRIKSADLVVRDDNGEIIPLSQRFNEENNDIRYSLKEDQAYMDAVNKGDMETAQRMVDEAAKRRGYDIKAYHGTGQRFTRFDRNKQGSNFDGYLQYGNGFYFAQSEKGAKAWGNFGQRYGGDDVMSVYLKADRMLDIQKEAPDWAKNFLLENGLSESEANFVTLNSDRFLRTLLEGLHMSNQEVQDLLISKGYDGIKELYRNATGQLVVFYPVQIKSADPVTYDDNGDVIPLSKRFTEMTDDIRYSLKDSDGNELTEAQAEYFKDSKLRDENGNLYVMYHGTENDFNVFDFSQGGKNGTAEGYGIYLSNSTDVTEHYGGRQIKSYVNMTRPASALESTTLTRPELRRLINASVELDANKMLDDYDGDMESAKKDSWISNYVNTYQMPMSKAVDEVIKSITEFNGNDMDIVQEIMNGMGIRDFDEASEFYDILTETTGIDGFVTKWGDESEMADPKTPVIAVAFRSNQIKNVTNENPTENEDIRYSIKEAPPMSELDKSGAILTTNNGDPIAEFDKDGSVKLSLKTYEDFGRDKYKTYLNGLVRKKELTREDANAMLAELETIYKISREFADSGKFAPFTAWSSADVVTDGNGNPVFSSVRANSEYKMNIDYSTICKKRRTLDNVFRVMVNRGLFEKLDLNKDESAALVVNINDLIREHGFEAACALCFVEARRYRQQQTATTFRDMWNGLVESMYKDKSKIDHFNYGKNNEVKGVPNGIHTMSDKDLNLSHVREIATAKNEEGKLLQTAEAKAARLLLRDPSQRKLMLIGDMMASTGFENMQIQNPELMKIYNSKKGTGGAKSSFGDVQYLNEIIKSRTFSRKSAYAVSGVRVQSFSDYVPRMVFDYVQMVADLASKRLPAHAYTKEVLFAMQFGLTGIKINMSLVPDVVADGVAPGLDKNGNYIWNKDGTFDFETARKLQKAEGYKENCGTIAVGISDEQIWKMLADPEIQMVIPYHKSSLNPLVAAMTNVSRFTDYTEYQTTKTKEGKTVEKEFDWDNKLFKLSHGKDGKLLPKSEWGDVQELTKEYIEWCEKHEYTPKFPQFLYMEDGSINPGYYKMLADFGLYDNDGNFKPQDDVKLRFPTENDEFGSMASLIEQGLSEDTVLESKRSNEIEGIVDEIEGMIEDGSITKQTISSEALAKKMTDADTRFQLKDNSTDSVAYKSTIAKLEDQVKDLKAEFKRTDLKTADPKQVRIQAGKLIKRHDSNMSLHGELQDTFNKIFRLYKENGEKAFDEVYEIAKNEAVSLVNGIGFIHDEGAEEYKAIKDYLRTTPITISEDMKKNITDYNDFRKRYFGKIKLVNGEQSNIDNVYMELAEMFPEQFTEDYVNPADQLYHMADVLDNYAPYYETLDGASPEMQDYVVEIASDIMETAYGLQTKKTFADKKYEEKIKAVQKAREKALETRNKALDRQKKRYEEKISALKEKNADYKEQTRENAEKKRRIKQISNIYKRLNEKLMTPSDTKHLPDGYAQIVAKVLKMFDFTTPGMEKWAERNGEPSKRYKYMSELRKQLDEMSKEESGMEIDSDLIDLVDELMADIGENDRLADLDSRVLEDIATLFRAFEHQINSYNKAFDENNKQNIAESAYRVFDDISSTKKAKWRLGVMGRLMTSNFNPSDFFTLVGGEVEELYSATRKGFDRYVSHLSDAKDFIQDTVKAKTADKWANHTGKYKTASGEEIALTDAQLMGLYCLSRREQAQNHIYFGGIISAPVKAKGRVIAKTLEEKRVIPTQEDLAEWFKKLSPEQMNVAEKIQKYLSTEPAEWGNETSMKLYGYKKFNEQMYYPIQSSKDYLDSNFDGKGTDPTLKNISPTKATVRNANNAIVVDDIFTVFSKHIAQMASYNAYVPAITDFQRVWNYTEGNDRDKVKAKFADAYGRNAANYIEDFFKNLNGVYKNNFDAGIFDKGLGLFKKAAVGGNIRVLVQQPTAIARAALIINPVYLTASVPKTAAQARKVYGEMMEHCPIAKWKSWGFYSSDITSASRDLRNIMIGKDALTDKVFMDMYGVADNATWTVIFNACKMQVEAKNKGIKKGSDEYWEKVNELASEVFDRTQVVDSPFHRSAIMKSQDKGIKMVTAFMAEPTKTVNMINTEMTLAARAVSEGHPAKAAGVFARVGMVVTANAALLAVAQALVDAMRGTGGDDDKDKGKYKDRFKAYWKEDFVDNVNLFGMIPFVKDVKSLWDGYDIARMDMNGIQKVIQSIQYLKKYYANPDESKYTKGEEWRNLALTMMYAAGVPISNAKRDLEAATLTAAEATNNPDVMLWFMKQKYQVNDKTKSLWISAYFDAQDKGNEGLARNIKQYMLDSGGVTEKDIEKKRQKRLKDNPTEEATQKLDKSMKTLEGSAIWKDAKEDDKTYYSGVLEKISVGIEDTQTGYVTNKAMSGLTNEEVILYKLALKKVDKPNKNGNLGTYTNDEKEEAIKLLAKNYKLTEEQKKILKG